MIQINNDLCIGCGLCVKDCIAENITVKDGHAKAYMDCFSCGHCVAICPKAAIEIPEYEMDDVKAYVPEAFHIAPENMLNTIKYRRSIRSYKDKNIEPAVVNTLFQAGRYTATAKNTQGCRFIFIQNQLDEFKERIWNGIGEQLEVEGAIPEDYRRFYRSHKRHPENDYLFRNAPAVLMVCSDNPIDAGLAAQNIELMANTMGLGVLYNGYLNRAASFIPGILPWLGTSDKPPAVTMLIGYPAIQYARTAPRKPADIIIH